MSGKIIRVATVVDIARAYDMNTIIAPDDEREPTLCPVIVELHTGGKRVIMNPQEDMIINGEIVRINNLSIAPVLTQWEEECMFLPTAEREKYANLIAVLQNKTILWLAAYHSALLHRDCIIKELIDIVWEICRFPAQMSMYVELLYISTLCYCRDEGGEMVELFIDFLIAGVITCDPTTVADKMPILRPATQDHIVMMFAAAEYMYTRLVDRCGVVSPMDILNNYEDISRAWVLYENGATGPLYDYLNYVFELYAVIGSMIEPYKQAKVRM